MSSRSQNDGRRGLVEGQRIDGSSVFDQLPGSTARCRWTYTRRMLHELVSDLRKQAERSAPAVKAAALLHIARVLTKIDAGEAARVLDEALALTVTLDDPDREILL